MSLNKYIQWLSATCLLFNLPISQALETAPVIHQTAVRYFYLDGNVEAINRTTVSAQTPGKIKEILFDVDDYVAKGSSILSLKDTEQLASVKKAEAAIQ